MGFYTAYQAIPARSRLLDRLRVEEPFCRLYTGLVPYGPGPFHLDQFDPCDLDAVLDGLMDDEVFSSRHEFERCLADLKAELAGTIAEAPGLERRATSIEKVHFEIRTGLTTTGLADHSELISWLIYGQGRLAPQFFQPFEPQLWLIDPPTVEWGAKVLAPVELFEDEQNNICDYTCEQFADWKALLIEAARRGEAMLVYQTG